MTETTRLAGRSAPREPICPVTGRPCNIWDIELQVVRLAEKMTVVEVAIKEQKRLLWTLIIMVLSASVAGLFAWARQP